MSRPSGTRADRAIPIRCARRCWRREAGADGITAHLREDRRHITDDDIARLSAELPIPLNLEMAATDEMLAIALRHRPHAACIVPEKREERTTEGGLDAAGQHNHLAPMVRELGAANVRVSLFIEPDPRQIEAALSLGAPVVEIHTGRYCELDGRGTGGRAAPNRRRRRAGGQERDRAACRARPDLRQCRADRRDPADPRAQYRPFPDRRGDLRRPRAGGAADARADGRGALIIGLGSDLCNIERIQNSLDRFGERFENRVLHRDRARQGQPPPVHQGRDAGQALRRQGSLFQGGRHRVQGRACS